MKVITLKPSWAILVVEGVQEYEFRTWKYNYRDEILKVLIMKQWKK